MEIVRQDTAVRMYGVVEESEGTGSGESGTVYFDE